MAENETKIFQILGVKDDEIVILSEINDFRGCGEASGQIHAITMRTISEEQIESSWDEMELYDFWKDAVSSGNTYSGLSDWIEEVKLEQDENLPFCDDDSFRYETENALEHLFVKSESDTETGNAFPNGYEHCQLGRAHDRHNEKQQFE